MIYGELPLAEMERAAWQRGDHATAELILLAIEHEESVNEAERLQSLIDGIQARITEANWRTGKKAELRELVESIVNELAEGK